MGWIDSHCHIIDEAFSDDFDEIIKRIEENNIERCMIVCCYDHEYDKAIALAKKDSRFDVAVGIHPSDVKKLNDDIWNKFIEYSSNPYVKAIGEIGLDYYWDKDNKDDQKDIFIRQIEIANKLNKPILVHSRDAMQDTFDIMKKYPAKGVMHCYSGSREMAKEFMKLGYYLSIGGPVTYKNANEPKEVAKIIDNDKILIETDCPYLTPVPFRGKRNEPSYVVYTGKYISELRNVDEDVFKDQLVNNYDRLFRCDI